MLGLNSWFFKRLQTISYAEFVFRAQQLFQYYFLKPRTGKELIPVYYSSINRILPVIESSCLDGFDKLNVFGIELEVSQIRNWHFDPYSHNSFPKIYSKSINIRTPEFGSAKHVWEVNRMLFLPQLAFLFKKTGNIEYLDQIKLLVSSWIIQNPYLVGVNWYSNIEVNIRLINWFLTWEILDVEVIINENPEWKEFVDKKWVPSIYQHCAFSYAHPSLYSSANNHLISEYAGLFIASSKWHFPESIKWNVYAKKGLEREIINQHSFNGVNKEEAAEYIQFITDFFLLCLIVGDRTGNVFSGKYKQQFKSIIYYINSFLDVKGNFPKYGDEDDGRVFIMDKTNHCNNFISLVQSGAIYFNDQSLCTNSCEVDQKNILLFGNEGVEYLKAAKNNQSDKKSAFYTQEGHFIFRKQEELREIYFHFDAAPLGFLSIAAHGHADALSFILHVDGQPVFVDPGTYCYHTDPHWRKYFLSTKAHNTITVNNESQACYVGPTLWLDHYKVDVKEMYQSDDYEMVKAEHNGYQKFGIGHSRKIEFHKKENRFIITDQILNNSGKEVFIEMPFHFHPSVSISLQRECLSICANSKQVKMNLDTKLTWSTYHGVETPALGWYSDSFYKKTPTSVLLGTITSSISETFRTEIRV